MTWAGSPWATVPWASLPPAAAQSNEGSLTVTLGALTLQSDADLKIKGSLSSTLGALTLSADGTVTSAPGTGTLNVTLGALTLLADADLKITGALSKTLGDLTLLADADLKIQGTLSSTLGALTLQSDGKTKTNGVLSVTLGALTLQSTGAIVSNPGGYSIKSRGTTLREVDITTGYPAPRTAVTTLITDISTPSAVLRVNGAAVINSSGSQGTGNYGNFILNVGSRNDAASRALNGRVYGMILRSAASSGDALSLGELYLQSGMPLSPLS
jgi:hypothetical protein